MVAPRPYYRKAAMPQRAWSPQAPAIVAALVERFTAGYADNPDMANVPVRDGPRAEQAPVRVLYVGFTGADAEVDVEEQFELDGLGNVEKETCTVRCCSAVLTGATDMPAARTLAYAQMTAAVQALNEDRKLGGLVLTSYVSSSELQQEQVQNGAQATVIFTITCDTFTSR